MSGLPKVSISLLNGQLGQVVSTDDQVAGVVMTSGTAPSGLAFGVSRQIFSVADAAAIGIDAAYDTTNSTNVFKTINDFYSIAGTGAELWIMVVVNTTTMSTICDTASSLMKKLLDDSQGRIRFAAVTRVPSMAYTPTYTGGLDSDVMAAAAKAQALGNAYANLFKPCRFIVDGRDFQGTLSALTDLTGSTYNRVRILISTNVSGSKNAAVGIELGKFASIPVQRNIGRVKDGDLGIQTAYMTGQTALIESLDPSALDTVYDKGYGFFRRFQGLNGYFCNDDLTACAATDDYRSFARGRVIDKAIVITYKTYVQELLDDLPTDEGGKIPAVVVKDYQNKIQSAIDLNMTANNEITKCSVTIDASQDVLATGKVAIKLALLPKFYDKEIDVTLGFSTN